MEFNQLHDRALQVRQMYSNLEREQYGESWDAKDIAMGLTGDVGDLMKLITAKFGKRTIEDVDAKLAHELSDCLWSLIVLADMFEVDLTREFMKTMDELEQHLAS